AYSPVKIINENIPLKMPVKNEPVKVNIENRYDFTNLNETDVYWNINGRGGVINPDIEPQSKGIMTFFPDVDIVPGDTLKLEFLRNGMMVDKYNLIIGERNRKEKVIKPSGKVKLEENVNEYLISGSKYLMTVNKKTGEININSCKGKEIISSGPELMILEDKNEIHSSGYPWPKPDVPPLEELNERCKNWQLTEITASSKKDGAKIIIEGRYEEATGQFILVFGDNGVLNIEYSFVTNKDMHPRQIGIVLFTPRKFDELSWERNSMWSSYPDNHIGRPKGTVKPYRPSYMPDVLRRTEPPWPWEMDSNKMGTNDFRATRTNIIKASLLDSEGSGITVNSDGSQQIRAFIHDKETGIIISDFYIPGLGSFMGEELRLQEFSDILPSGSIVKGLIKLSLKK
ncbi:MAG TPA: hypothetical protein DEQ09_05405, partial [Bacteroidales bacterium]|nr:hypothetical protein [Bacteroidales bacterium]